MKLFLIVYLSLISNTYATTFYPVPLKEQIKTSQAVVQGVIVSSSVVENEDFGLITEVEIEPSRFLGEEKLNGRNITARFPGGSLSGRVVEFPGAPNLNVGEQVVLLLSEQNNNYWVNNLGMGKYSVKNIGDKKVIVNQIFPENPEMGHMSLKRFFKLVEFVKHEKFVEVNKSRFEIEEEKKRKSYKSRGQGGRSIASQSIVEQREQFPLVWLVIILGCLGFLFRLFKNSKQ